MKIKMKHIFTFLMLFLIIFSISTQNNLKNSIENVQEDLQDRTTNLNQAGFWNNFTFIHITNLNWTVANETDWCSGSGTWDNPYLIENMIINASDSPTGCGIFIENSVNVYFTIRNVTIFETTNGIKLENTNKGTFTNNILSNNGENGIYMVNGVNNTISNNQLINNGMYGINFSSNCLNNKIVGNIAKNEGTNLQDGGIYLANFCDGNEIIENIVYDNNVHGINIEDSCEGNLIYNNTLKNVVGNQQGYGIRLDSDCNQNNISLNTIENLNNFGIMMVTSDQNSVTNNQIIDISIGMYMLIAHQNKLISNTISGSSTAIFMSACDWGEIIGNIINNTTNYAIRIFINCDDNEFRDNIVKDNIGMGIQLDDPSDINNKFYKNSFISNGVHAYDNGTTTSWNNTMIGNYWDNYTGSDSNDDLIGDISHNIPGTANSNDSLPIWDDGDDLFPEIAINSPTNGSIFTLPPEFIIDFSDVNFDRLWVTINYSNIEYGFIASPGNNVVIDMPFSIWNLLPEGYFLVKIYVNDTAGNVNYAEITFIKELPPEPPPPDIVIIIIISAIVISIIAIAGILMRKLPNKDKIKKSRKLDEEQLSKAQYFKDVSSILTILAIHNESGLFLSKIAVRGGTGLDENLFTGFISAMGSFKDELAKQMGLQVKDKGKDNVIEYNEFTITLMDGEYLRLGLVSYDSLGVLIKKKCGQVLTAYETKHIDDLKNFEGEIQVFNDFEEIIDKGLDMNLNKKSIINTKQLNKYDAPESFITILNDLNSRSDGFYPAEITLILVREMNISEQEANFMVYEAYKNQIFLPTKLER
ncbi:MAG: right-handed parallel beta-helix repeat-containing protein [Candidatus Lokiarchaeota archaeon]|nr:right-handed parallel beta-helix repeat-containing protein [Candidatus Lokiarchaeota archaeon]